MLMLGMIYGRHTPNGIDPLQTKMPDEWKRLVMLDMAEDKTAIIHTKKT